MKRKSLYFTLFVLLTAFQVSATGINFEKGSWKDVVKKATEAKKPIFVDFYAVWCGPCKYMSKNVFTDSEVAGYYNANYISFKVDAENEESDLVNKMSLQGYPTMGYFSPDGNLISVYVGALEATDLLDKGKQVIQYRAAKTSYNKNPDNPQILKNYLIAAKDLDIAETKKIARDYLGRLSEEDLKKDENWPFILSFGTDYTSREFKFVADHADYYKKHGNALKEYFKNSSRPLLSEAIEQKDPAKAELYKKYFLQIHSAIGQLTFPEDYYKSLIDLMYLDGINDFAKFYPLAVKWLDTYNLNNAETLCEYAIKISEKSKDPEHLATCIRYAEKAVTLSDNYSAHYTLSYLLYQTGNKTKAIEHGTLARDKCADPQVLPYLEEYLKKIK